MRHVYIRGILGVIWMVSLAVCVISGNLMMAGFYGVMGGLCLYSAYIAGRKEKERKERQMR